MSILDALFESNTLKEFLKVCNDVYTREAVESLSEFFSGTMPTLREVCDVTIEYCNAEDSSCDDNVYLLTAPNGKKYAGQTVNWNERMKQYQKNNGSNKHWKSALTKYGIEKFKIEYCSIPTSCSDIIEKFMILWYDLMYRDKGYNKQSGGKNGWMISDEVRAKMSMALLGVSKSADHKAALKASWTSVRRLKYSALNSGENNPMFGKKDSEETRAKRRVATSGENNGMFGKKQSKESRAKMSIAKSGEKHPRSKPVIVHGKLYSYAGEASRNEFPQYSENYVRSIICNYKTSNKIFQISREFYADCLRKNTTENITREMHENYYYFI